jgi:hypothetical protein
MRLLPKSPPKGLGKNEQYYRVRPKAGLHHLATKLWDGSFETFCGRRIAADAYHSAWTITCYQGDECLRCRNAVSVDGWVPEPGAVVPEGKLIKVTYMRLKPCSEASGPPKP